MSATAGPIVPSISGRLLDLFDPSSETVMDRLAEPLMRMFLLPMGVTNRQAPATPGGACCKIMADCHRTQPSRSQQYPVCVRLDRLSLECLGSFWLIVVAIAAAQFRLQQL